MATIPSGIIDDIRSRVDIADLIASYGVQIKRAGGSWKACCPFHHEKTPSFHIRPERGRYHCFGCGEDGDCFTFVMKQEGLTFIEAVKKLAQQVGVTIQEQEDPEAGMRKRLYALHAELAAFFRRCLKEAQEAEPARRYLASRAIPDDVAEAFLVGYAPLRADAMLAWAEKHGFTPEELAAAGVLLPPTQEINRWYNRFGGRLMFAIKDRSGRTVAFSGRILTNDKKKAKYVNSPETAIFRKSNVLYAFDRAAGAIVKAPGREAIVCEGQIDVIRCHACGFTTAVASEGTAFTEEHVNILRRCADSVVLVFDADGAGRKAAVKTGGLFLAAGVPARVATLPAGEDPDSLLRTQGPGAFRAALDAAESVTHFQVRTMREAETNPNSIDAVRRIARAALETIAKCPVAVMRAALMQEAAELMGIPVAALEADFVGVEKSASRTVRRAPESAEPVVAAVSPSEPPVPAPEIAGEDAGATEANPPPVRELAFCEFLFANDPSTAVGARGTSLGETVAKYMPPSLFVHPFTRMFLQAWAADGDYSAFRERISPADVVWLDAVLLNAERATMSEMPPGKIFEEFLRQFWNEAVKRRQGMLNVAQDLDRVRLSGLARKFLRAKLEAVLPLMTAETLGLEDEAGPGAQEPGGEGESEEDEEEF